MNLRVAKKIHGARRGARERFGRWVRATVTLCRGARRGSRLLPHRKGLMDIRPGYSVDFGDGARPAANLLEWALWFECGPLRRVAYTTVGTTSVSTVALGIPHGMGSDELYESAWIFDEPRADERGGKIEPCARYGTRREATAGHARLVEELRRKTATT
jgi:hypothetical protein